MMIMGSDFALFFEALRRGQSDEDNGWSIAATNPHAVELKRLLLPTFVHQRFLLIARFFCCVLHESFYF